MATQVVVDTAFEVKGHWIGKERSVAERKARREGRQAKKTQLEAERKAKQAEVAAYQASVTIKYIALDRSAIVTCGAGLSVLNFLCASDCCYATVGGLPKDMKEDEVEELIVQRGVERSKFWLFQLRQVGESLEARVMVEAETGNAVAATFDGSPLGETSILSFNVEENSSSTNAALNKEPGKDATTHCLSANHPNKDIDFHHATNADTQGAICPVCFGEPSPAVFLGCGHLYCTDCITTYLTSAIQGQQFPLLCLGNEDKCKTPITIPIIRQLLSPQDLERLVGAAFTLYITTQPDKFRYCASPGCNQVYRCDGGKQTFTCPSCSTSVCISCRNVPHEGMTCEEYGLQELERKNDEWAATAGAKRCPKCQVFIQKTEGCNHMTCRCGAHICWRCLALFDDSSSTSNHLRQVHGGLY